MGSKKTKKRPAKKARMARRKTAGPKSRSRNKAPYGLLWLPVFIFFLMLSGLAVFYVWERIKLREISREIIEMDRARKLLVEENKRLRAQAEELSSYRRIYEIGTQRLGLVELKPKIIYIPSNKKN